MARFEIEVPEDAVDQLRGVVFAMSGKLKPVLNPEEKSAMAGKIWSEQAEKSRKYATQIREADRACNPLFLKNMRDYANHLVDWAGSREFFVDRDMVAEAATMYFGSYEPSDTPPPYAGFNLGSENSKPYFYRIMGTRINDLFPLDANMTIEYYGLNGAAGVGKGLLAERYNLPVSSVTQRVDMAARTIMFDKRSPLPYLLRKDRLVSNENLADFNFA